MVKKGRRRFFIPKEHGAWAMLYVPFVTGVCVAAHWNIVVLLLFLAITFGYLSRLPFIEWLRSKYKNRYALSFFIGYASIGILAYLTLLFLYKLWGLLSFLAIGGILGAFYAYQTLKGKHRSITGELVGVLGLTFTAPMAHYVASNSLTKMAFMLWLLNALFFSSSIFYVKLRLEAYLRRKEFELRRFAKQTVRYVQQFTFSKPPERANHKTKSLVKRSELCLRSKPVLHKALRRW